MAGGVVDFDVFCGDIEGEDDVEDSERDVNESNQNIRFIGRPVKLTSSSYAVRKYIFF